MSKKILLFFSLLTLLVGSFLVPSDVDAATLYKGTFVQVQYNDYQRSDGTIEKKPSKLTIKSSNGKETTFNMDSFTKLSINSTPTTIDAFKLGMKIEADVELRKVKTLRGYVDISNSSTDAIGKNFSGTVNRIDKKGTYLSIKLTSGATKTYYINDDTEFYKDKSLVDLSVLFEGDKVKGSLVEHNSNMISTIEVNTQGAMIENIYKGTIQKIDPIQSKLVVKNEKIFKDWKWQTDTSNNIVKTYTPKTTIYVGNKEIKQSQLRSYINDEVYYVTVSQFGKEVIQKIIIQKTSERTYYQPMTSINITTQKIGLKNVGILPYHTGSILIRNGRLVDANSLQTSGTAFVLTDGPANKQFANVIQITNDGFQSSNLADHTIYFGRISSTGDYSLTINNANRLANNYWIGTSNTKLTFNNETVAVEDFRRSTLTVIPKNELDEKVGQFAYFYVKNNEITALHLVGSTTRPANLVSVGRLESYSNGNTIRVQNVSSWQQGTWKEAGKIYNMNVEQATIIKDNQVIPVSDLTPNDRLFIIHESIVKGRLIFVD